MSDLHDDCYTEFDLVWGEDTITLVGYWNHDDGKSGVDELAAFLTEEYANDVINAKARAIVKLLNRGVQCHIE